MEITLKPRRFLDRMPALTTNSTGDEPGFLLRIEENNPDTTTADTTKPSSQRQNENRSLLLGKMETTTPRQQQTLIFDGSHGATTPGPANGCGIILGNTPYDGSRGTTALGPVGECAHSRDAESAPVPTIVERGRPSGQEHIEEPSTTPSIPSLNLPEEITMEHEIMLVKKLEFLGLGGSGYVYKCPGGFAYKQNASQREIDLMKAAGDCSITPLSRVLRKIEGVLVPRGLIMELATPFDFRLVPAEEREAVKEEMVGLVERLHSEFGIVHGDIKPANFLRCRDGKLRLCDFDSGRLIADEEAEGWEGFVSDRYLAPNRGFPDVYGPPTVDDDSYALAISVWELFTGKDALIDDDMEDVLKVGGTVDVDELEDANIREFVRERLRAGGAKI